MFFSVFPFHLVFNRSLTITNIGSGLQSVAPHLLGQPIDEMFVLLRPMVEFSMENVRISFRFFLEFLHNYNFARHEYQRPSVHKLSLFYYKQSSLWNTHWTQRDTLLRHFWLTVWLRPRNVTDIKGRCVNKCSKQVPCQSSCHDMWLCACARSLPAQQSVSSFLHSLYSLFHRLMFIWIRRRQVQVGVWVP